MTASPPFLRRIFKGADAGSEGAERAAAQRVYGSNWVPVDEAEAMDQILNVRDPEAFEAAGRFDAETLLAPHIGRDDAVLDLGCGIGRVVRYVAPLCREVCAVDASKTMLDYARTRLAHLPNVRFVLGEGASLGAVESGSIDFAYSLLTLQHVEREHAFLLLRELRRVLRPEGSAVLTFPNLLSDVYLEAFVQYAERDETANPARARFYTPEEVRRLLPVAGLSVRDLVADVEIVVTCDVADPA
jgi:ubiquinone/menaquinone biosynthesis C-methylase UbiE